MAFLAKRASNAAAKKVAVAAMAVPTVPIARTPQAVGAFTPIGKEC